METTLEWLNYRIAGNEIWRIIVLFIALLAAGIGGKIARLYLDKLGKRLQTGERASLAAALLALSKAIPAMAFAIGFSLGIGFLTLVDTIDGWVATSAEILTIFAVAYGLYCLVDALNEWLSRAASKTESSLDDMLVPMVRKSLRVTIVLMALIQSATALSDKPLTSIIAGLGVGGLAIALAGQDTIKNFFGSLVILADKPFELNELVSVDGHTGSIEEVGFRSTRIRTLAGHQVSIPNGELANKTIENIGRRPSIRRLLNVTITYDTPPEKVEEAVSIVQELLDNHEGMHADFPPRVFFNEFNQSSLNLFVIYWYHPADFWAYMAFTHRFNLQLLRRFNEAGIEFAFPTQTIHLAGAEASNAGLTHASENREQLEPTQQF